MPKIGSTPPRSALVPLKPFWSTTDGDTVKLYQGHAPLVLRQLPAGSVHCVVTSPPYWGLRDYGTGTWEGGREDCDHKQVINRQKLAEAANKWAGGNRNPNRQDNGTITKEYAALCGKCGATRTDMQLGSEPSPDCGTQGKAQCGKCFVCSMVGVFREVKRVLRDDGTLWLNLGDSYSGGGGYYPDAPSNQNGGSKESRQTEDRGAKPKAIKYRGLAGGNLVGVPWRVALALQADGWILRQDIIWHKPSPMPESVRNRCTKAHEYVFLLTKRMGYFCDMEAIRTRTGKESTPEEYAAALAANGDEGNSDWYQRSSSKIKDGSKSGNPWHGITNPNGSNKRSVWSVSSQGYDGAHFATFPPKLIEPCILAGTSEKGCCAKCGAPWKRIVEDKALKRERPNEYVKYAELSSEKKNKVPGQSPGEGFAREEYERKQGVNSCPNGVAGVEVKTVGWEPTCECFGKFVKQKVWRPGKAGTTGVDVPNGWAVGKGTPHDAASYQQEGIKAKGDEQTRRAAEASELGYEETVTEYVSDLSLDEHPVVPCTICDPFIGSGTSCVVALENGRRSIGIDLSEKYLRANAVPRIEGTLLSRPGMSGLVGKTVKKIKWDSTGETT